MVSMHEKPKVSCNSEIPNHFCVKGTVVVGYYYNPEKDCRYKPYPEIEFDNGHAISSGDLGMYVFGVEF
jgi:hypothetical protein